jgi:hypothetical protein
MRYYGFYAWLAYRYAKDVRDTSTETWCIYIRRAEALYALVAQHNGGERGVAGSRWATRMLESTPGNRVVFHQNTDRESGEPQYLKQKFGAFGAAYGSQLAEIGVLDKTEDHDVPVPAEGLGDAMAQAFESAVGNAAGIFLAAARAGKVTKSDLENMQQMQPSRIAKTGRERQLYEDILFGKGHPLASAAGARSQTLKLILRVAAELGHGPSVDDVRWAMYSSHTDAGEALRPVPSAEEGHKFAWTVYQANDLLHICYEAILKHTLDVLGAHPSGIPIDQLVATVVSRLTSALEWRPVTWQSIVDKVDLVDNAWSHDEQFSDYALMLGVLEASDTVSICSDECGASAINLLAVLYKRFTERLPEISVQLPVVAQPPYIQSLVTELRYLATHAQEPFEDLLSRLVYSRILQRHLWVAIQKFRGQGDYTFLLESDDGRVRVRQKDGPGLTNPRLSSACRR